MLNKFNKIMNTNFKSTQELTNALTKMFIEETCRTSDYQEAFNNLNDMIGGNLLAEYYCYSLSVGGEWSIYISDQFSEEMLQAFINDGWKVKDIDDLACEIESKVMDTECNAGCDAFTALELEMEDFPIGYEWCDYIEISVPCGDPYLELA